MNESINFFIPFFYYTLDSTQHNDILKPTKIKKIVFRPFFSLIFHCFIIVDCVVLCFSRKRLLLRRFCLFVSLFDSLGFYCDTARTRRQRMSQDKTRHIKHKDSNAPMINSFLNPFLYHRCQTNSKNTL